MAAPREADAVERAQRRERESHTLAISRSPSPPSRTRTHFLHSIFFLRPGGINHRTPAAPRRACHLACPERHAGTGSNEPALVSRVSAFAPSTNFWTIIVHVSGYDLREAQHRRKPSVSSDLPLGLPAAPDARWAHMHVNRTRTLASPSPILYGASISPSRQNLKNEMVSPPDFFASYSK